MSELVIHDVGLTLIELLRSELGGPGNLVPNPDHIALMSPVDAEAERIRLTLFLYSVTPTAELRNAELPPAHPGPSRRNPLPLDLYYLMTSFAPDTIQDPTDRTLEAHRLLGTAMQVMYDHGTLSGSLLRGDLALDERLRLTLQPITVEDLTRIWSVFPDNAYRASVSYLVTPARIESDRFIDGQRVVQTRTDVDRIVPHSRLPEHALGT